MRRRELAQVRHEINEVSNWAMQQDQMLEVRITALEEIEAARWPRRVLVRRRLRRELRASVRHAQGAGFTERRINSVSTGWDVTR